MYQVNSIGHKIEIGKKALNKLSAFLKTKDHSKYFILCDENTLKFCLPVLVNHCKILEKAEIIEIESGEASKNIDLCIQVWATLIECNADKNCLFINLGGGVVSDLGGFVASVYKRGIDFINIPTSLLAMADAGIGGKTGIDFAGIKNSIGSIIQPKGVFVFPQFLDTLPQDQFDNGLSEIYKIALISDIAFWKKLASQKGLSGVEEIIYRSIVLKNSIVKKDPFEKNIRRSLNFGHTIGHAIESSLLKTKSELLHGEAVLIGMICESLISMQKKLITKKEFLEILNTLLERFIFLPVQSSYFEAILQALANDKKTNKGVIRCALLNGMGKCKINVSVNLKQVKDSLELYNSFIK
jgi:3-dehydroquinate synthase